MLPQIHTQRMYKQVRKQRALVTGLGILMKNSNNIKWGVSTADTLMLRALQTHRVTRHTHYSGTVQPLSVMMMAALTRHWLLKSPPPANTALGRGKKNKKKNVRSRCVQTCHFLRGLPAAKRHGSPGFSSSCWPSILLLQWPLHQGLCSWKTQIKVSVPRDSNCPPAQRPDVMPPDRWAFQSQASDSSIHLGSLIAGRRKKKQHTTP